MLGAGDKDGDLLYDVVSVCARDLLREDRPHLTPRDYLPMGEGVGTYSYDAQTLRSFLERLIVEINEKLKCSYMPTKEFLNKQKVTSTYSAVKIATWSWLFKKVSKDDAVLARLRALK